MILEPLSAHSSPEQRLFMEALITSAFPKAEYRDMELMRQLIDKERRFQACLIQTEEAQSVGIVNYWDFKSFIYIEHLAIVPEFRNQGIGATALEALRARHAHTPLVLEAELPIGEMEKRRIGFYLRCGFTALPEKYHQPAYRKQDKPIEMVLLERTQDIPSPGYSQIRETIYREAYRLSDQEAEKLINAD